MDRLKETVERVAWFVPPSPEDLNYDGDDRYRRDKARAAAVRHVAIAANDKAWRWYIRNRQALESSLRDGLPVPVLSITHADKKETGWTRYLAHMFDPEAAHGIGEKLLEAFFKAVVGEKWKRTGGWSTQTEVALPPSRCGDEIAHHNSLDLLLMDQKHAIAIEQKIDAAESNWKCEVCEGRNHPGKRSQLTEYGSALTEATKKGGVLVGRTVHRIYLTPSGKPAGEGTPRWESLRHSDLADILSTALTSDLLPAQRYALIALLMDLNGRRLGKWNYVIGEARQIVLGPNWKEASPRFLSLFKIHRLYGLFRKEQGLQHLFCSHPEHVEQGGGNMDKISDAGLAYLENAKALAEAKEEAEDYLKSLWPKVRSELKRRPQDNLASTTWQEPGVVETKTRANLGLCIETEAFAREELATLKVPLSVAMRDFRDPLAIGLDIDGLEVQVTLSCGNHENAKLLRDAIDSGHFESVLGKKRVPEWHGVPDKSTLLCSVVTLTGEMALDRDEIVKRAMIGMEILEKLLSPAKVEES